MVTITISGFKTKKQAISWLEQYEGGIEQNFEEPDACVDMTSYITEMASFKKNKTSNNFNLELNIE